jgi:hypothetical protein
MWKGWSRHDICKNHLKLGGGQLLAELLLVHTAVRSLVVRSNDLKDDGVRSMAEEALRSNATLTFLHLQDNGIKDGGGQQGHSKPDSSSEFRVQLFESNFTFIPSRIFGLHQAPQANSFVIRYCSNKLTVPTRSNKHTHQVPSHQALSSGSTDINLTKLEWVTREALTQGKRVYRVDVDLPRECCLLVLNLVSSTLSQMPLMPCRRRHSGR